MARPLLVACPRRTWDALVSGSGLSAGLFSDELPTEYESQSVGRIFYLGELARNPEELTTDELERMDRSLFSCRDGTFVWLHRFEADAETERETLQRAAAAWHMLVAERKRRFAKVIRAVAVIVGGDSTREAEQEFRRFLSRIPLPHEQEPPGFVDVFVMGPRLEPRHREIFHARSVWPVAVSRLMLGLLSGEEPGPSAGAVKAWRFKEFRQNSPQWLYEKLVPAFTDALFERFRRGASVDAGTGHDRAVVTSIFRTREPEPGQWPASGVAHIAEHDTAPGAVLQRLKEAGREDSLALTKDAAEVWAKGEKGLENFWSRIRERSGEAWTAEEHLQRATTHGVRDLAQAHLLAVASAHDRISDAAEHLRNGAAELELAEAGFVQRWFRLAIGLTVASLVGVLFFKGALLQFQSVAVALFIASGTFTGALVSVSAFYVMESRRGDEALREWRRRYAAFEETVKALNDGLVGLKNAASIFATTAANATRRSKNLRLLSRMTGAVAPVFQASTVMHASDGADATMQVARHRMRYLALSTEGWGDRQRLEDQDDVDRAIRQLLDEDKFAERVGEVWVELLKRSDKHKQGVVDAGLLREAMSSVLLQLPGEIERVTAGKDEEVARQFAEAMTTCLRADDHDDRGLFSVEVGDGVKTEFSRYVLVPDRRLSDLSERNRDRVFPLPGPAASSVGALLIETADIRPIGDLVPVGENRDAEQ